MDSDDDYDENDFFNFIDIIEDQIEKTTQKTKTNIGKKERKLNQYLAHLELSLMYINKTFDLYKIIKYDKK